MPEDNPSVGQRVYLRIESRISLRRKVNLTAIALILLSIFGQGLFRVSSAHAATNDTLTFQARLLQSSGALVADGTYNVEFKIYDSAAAGGTAQGVCSTTSTGDDCWWMETRTGADKVTVKNGYVYANLGSVTPFGSSIPWDQELWITMNIGGTGAPSWDGEMSPRFKVTAVPYALSAAKLAGTTGNFTADDFIQKAPNSVQTDTTTNSSIFLNKTGASGNLLQLQGNGTDVLSLTKAGALTVTGTANISGDLTVDTNTLLVDAANDAIGVRVTPTATDTLVVSNGSTTDDIFRLLDNATTVLTVADGGATTLRNQTDSTAAFQVQSASSGVPVLTVDTTNSTTILRGVNSNASISGTNLAASTVCTGTNWSGTGPWAHTAGSTSNLTCTLPASVTIGATYNVAFQISGNTVSGNNVVSMNVGGQSTAYVGDNNWQSLVITATTTGGVNFTPSSAFNGSITNINVNQITQSNSTLTLQDSTGGTIFETRGSVANGSTFLGYQAGINSTSGSYSNTAIGYQALMSNTYGGNNTAIGYQALQNNTEGYSNVSVGTSALSLNTTGYENISIGDFSLNSNTSGHNNIGIGVESLNRTTSAFYNTAIGYTSGYEITTGSYNTALGYSALRYGNTGSYNTAIGYAAGYRNSTGDFRIQGDLANSTAIGAYAQSYLNNSVILGGQGVDQVAGYGFGTGSPTNFLSVTPKLYDTGTVGTTSGSGSVTGAGTTFTADMVGSEIFIASNSTTIPTYKGTVTGFTNGTSITVSPNVGFTRSGASYYILNAGLQVTSSGKVGVGSLTPGAQLEVKVPNGGSTNAFIVNNGISTGSIFEAQDNGTSVLTIADGGNISATGQLLLSGTGSNQSQFIVRANSGQTFANPLVVLQDSTTAELARINATTSSLYFGNGAGGSSASGANNVAVGASALGVASTGAANTTLGSGALASITTTSNNTAVGYNAGNLLTGANNILLGYQAGDNLVNGSNNIIIGYDLNASSSTVSNELRIGGILQGDTSTLAAQFNGALTVAAGSTFTNNSSTLFTALSISDKPTGGDIGTAATTVDIATAFNVNQTTASQALTLPTPTVTAAGRIVYINNVGSANFSIYGGAIAAGKTGSFIWNGTAWVQTISFASTGTDTIGAIDSGVYSANGASISGTTIYLQSASSTHVGLVTIGAQNFAGVKTFDDGAEIAAGKTLRVIGGNTASRPASPTEGMVYFDTDTKQLLTYANGKWQADRSDAVLVAASNSSQNDKDAADYVANGDTGAANDGDQVQINAALTAAAGRKVVLLAGTYVADASISVPNNTTLTGVGTGTIVELADLDAAENLIENSDTATGTGITVRDMKLDGRDDLNTAGIQVGVYMNVVGSNSIAGAHIQNLYVEDFRNEGIKLDNSARSVVSDNQVYSNGYAGISIYLTNDSTVVGNIVEDSAEIGIEVVIGSNNTVTGNVIRNTGNGSTTGSAIMVNLASNNNVVASNTIQGTDISGITVNGSSANTISGNNIQNSGGSTDNNAIFLTNADSNSITSNVITDNSCSTTCYAINISDNTSDNTYVSGNTYSVTAGSDQSTIVDAGTNTRYASQITPAQILQSGSSLIKANATSVLTGSIDPAASTTVPGVGTKFTTELQIGDRITVSGETRTVTAIASDTSLTVDTAFSNNANDTSPDRLPAALIVQGSNGVSQLLIQDNGAITATSLVTLNGGLTVETGDTFTFNGDAFTDLTGSGLTISSGALTVDTTSSTGAFINGGNAFTANSTLGNTGNYDLNIITNNTTRLTVEADGDVVLAAGKSLRVTGGNTASRPASPTEGMVYFDTDTKQLLTYSNGKWQGDRSTATKIVAASNSSQAIKDSADYVADGTGDEVEINAALSAAAGGKVYLAEGTYVAAATILIPNNTTLAGAGRNTLIELADLDATDNLIENSDTTTGTGIVIRDLRISGRNDLNTAGTQYGIYLNEMGGPRATAARKGALITQVEASNFRNDSVYLTASSNTTVSNNYFHDNTVNGIYFNDSAYVNLTGNTSSANTITGFDLRYLNDSSITSNVSYGNTTSYGFYLGNITRGGISNNTARSNTGSGFYASGLDQTKLDSNVSQSNGRAGYYLAYLTYVTLTSNIAKDNGTGSSSYGGITVFYMTDSTISDSVVQGNGGGGTGGIWLYDSDRNTVNNNLVTANNASGIILSHQSDYNNITNNRIHDNGSTSSSLYGIYLTATGGGGDYNVISGNYITDTAGGARAIRIASTGGDYNTISANRFGTGAQGVWNAAGPIDDAGVGTIYSVQTKAGGTFESGSTLLKAFATNVLTGSIDPTASTSVTGVGTLFTTEIQVGDRITVSGETRTVTVITSDTALTVDTAFSDNANDTTPDRLPAALIVQNSSGVNQLVVQDNGNVVLTADLAVNGGDITSTGDLTITPAGGDTIVTGTLAVTTLGATDTATFLCRNSSNQIAGCNYTPLSSSLTDNITDALDIQEGTNNYFNINTTNSSENISFGNATTNPSYSFLGTGAITAGGTLSVTATAPNSSNGAGVTVTPTLTSATNNQNGVFVNVTAQPTASSSQTYAGIRSQINNGLDNLTNGKLIGVDGYVSNSGAYGVDTTIGGRFQISNTGSGGITNGYGVQILANTKPLGVLTNNVGLYVANQTEGTNKINIFTGTTVPTGDWNIYSDSTYDNAIAGDLRVGGTTAPTVALDVTGAALISTTLGVTGNTTLTADLAVNGNTTIGDATTDRLTVTSQILGASPLVFQGATDNGFATTFAVTDPTANNTITFPDASGTVQLAPTSGSYLFQVPANTAANTVTPTANSTVGLTVNGTSGTAATALAVVQTGTATAATISQSQNNSALAVTANGLTTATGLSVTSTGVLTTTGNIATFTANSATTATGVVAINATGLTTGAALNVTANNSALAINATGNVNATGQLTLLGTGGNQSQLVVKQNASQTIANPLVVLQTSGGTELARINAFGTGNIGFGNNILNALTSGTYNVAIGSNALDSATTGGNNIAIGRDALTANNSNFSVAIGTSALALSTQGENTAVGYNALSSAVNNLQSTGIGAYALEAATGNFNTAVGRASLQYTSGQENVAVGTGAGTGVNATSTFSFSTIVGSDAGLALTTGANNTFLGRQAGTAVTTQSNNVLLGYNAGNNLTTGTGNNIIIGAGLQASSATVANELRIGGVLQGDTSTLAAQFNGALTVVGNTTIGNATTDRLTVTSQILGGSPLVFQGATDNGFATTFAVTDPTANNTITFPNASGTVLLGATGSGNAIVQVPTSNTSGAQGANIIAPTAASIVGLTVNGTTSTAATALSVVQTGAATALNINSTSTGNILQLQKSAVDVLTVSNTGSALFQNSTDSTTGFNIKTRTGSANLFTVDTTNSRVGINLGGSNIPTLNGGGLEVNGALRLSGGLGAGLYDVFTTPLGSSAKTKINIPLFSPAATEQVLAFGVNSGASTDSRVLTIYDARTTTDNDPAISLVAPDENNVFGLGFDGSNTAGSLKTNSRSAVATIGINVKTGNTAGTGVSSGAISLFTGNGTGTNSSSGNISLDSGTKTGTGTTGTITLGAANASAVVLGRTGVTTTNNGALTVTELTTLNGNLTVQAGDTFTFNGDAFTDFTGGGLVNTGGVLTVDTTSATGAFINGGNAFTANSTLGNTGNYSLSVMTNNISRLTVAANGDLAVDTNTFAVDSVNDLVGIGTTTPNYKLHVTGGQVAVDAGGAPNPTYTFAGNSDDTGLFTPSDDVLGFTTAGVERLRITDTGGVELNSAASNSLYIARTGGAANEANIAFNTNGGDVGQIRGISGGGIRFTNSTAVTEWARFASTGDLTVSTSETITPTTNSAVALTVNGTSGTAATALAVAQTGTATALTVSQTQNNSAIAVTANGLTTATGLSVTSTGVLTSTGNLATFTANSATTATGVVTISATGLTTGAALNVVANNSATAIKALGNIQFAQGGARTLSVETTSSNAAGSALTISAGSAGTGAAAFVGGALTLQGGNAAGTGNANGGNVSLTGGTGIGTGVRGLVVIDTPTYNTATAQNFTANANITQANIDNLAGISITENQAGWIATLTDPTNTTAGRVIYITNAGNYDVTLAANTVGVGLSVTLKPASTATMFWNGADWTAAGASSSTDLQAAYSNTATSAGAAEIVLSSTGTGGLTVRNDGTTPIIGGLLEVQTSIGSNLFTVNNNATEYANNGGAESSTFTMWAAAPAGGTVTRYTTVDSNIATGVGSVFSNNTSTANTGIKNTLTTTLTQNLKYKVSYTVRASTTTAFTTLDTIYSSDGTSTTQTCASGSTVDYSGWTRVDCSFTATAVGASNAIIIRHSDAVDHDFYVDNLSVTVSADVNHAADGSVDLALGSNWTDFGANTSGTTAAIRNTTILYDTSGSVEKTTGATTDRGIVNNLGISPSINTQYLVTFYAKLLSGTFNDIRVRYSRDGGTNFVTCVDYNTQTVSTSAFTKITCVFTADGTAPSNADLVIDQPTATARTFYIDALSVTLNTNNSSNVQVGGANKGGPTTLFTLDRSNGAPIAANNDAYLGSMYYDTSTGRIQCYEADGWGACGSAPDNIVNLNPEYAGAVLNGTGVGVMSANFCSNDTALSINSTLCSTGQAKNYYQWTSPQATTQSYSIIVTYQLPATFKGFADDQTVQLVARADDTTKAEVTYEMFKSDGSAVTACGTATTVTTTNNTWQSVGINGNESTGCSFNTSSAGNFVIFKINVSAKGGANAYVSTLSFTTTGR